MNAILLTTLACALLNSSGAESIVGVTLVPSLILATQGFSSVELHNLKLARYSPELQRWVGEFRATRVFDKTHIISAVDLRLDVILKDGTKKSIPIPQDMSGMQLEYFKNLDPIYKPEDLASYQLVIARESWIDEAKLQAEEAERWREKQERATEERRKLSAKCHLIYRQTSDKKMSDLTVKETREIQACETLDLYQ